MHTQATNRPLLAACLLWAASLVGVVLPVIGAGIPEPYNLVYGVIKLGEATITAADTNVVVEARRFPTSTAFASYRMGSRAAAADYYALQLSVEQKVTGQNISTEASESGTVVYLTVLSGGRVMDQVSYTMGGRGTARQIDFGDVDNDNDGLPDGWEQAYLYGLESGPEDDPDRDGETNRNEFLLGLNPLVMDARHPADINPADGRLTIQEVSAYYTAWRNGTNQWNQTLANGTTVARGPVPIPVEYVTRATFIWERGEKYVLNAKTASSAPLWWVPETTAATTSVGDEMASKDSGGALDGSLAVLDGSKSRRPANSSTAKSEKTPMRVVSTAPVNFANGDLVTVTNDVTILSGLRTYAVEHYPPAGWEIVAISAGGYYDSVYQRVKWGPFFDRQPRQLTYTMKAVKPAKSADAVALVGASAYDGIPVEIEGQQSIFIIPGEERRLVLQAGSTLGRWKLQGQPGRIYELSRSTNLSQWMPVQQVPADDAGLVEFTDDRMDSETSGYFRARELP